MWMVGYTEGGDFNMVDHSFNARKLRPLIMPRPMTSLNNAPTPTTANPTLALIHGNDLFPQYHYHHLGIVGEQNKREELNGGTQVVVSSRWNPTAEQLRALEELYRRGTRTPSAEQIQHITAQLRRFGKIEGKNVFYWFQNHKARERQKRRRQMELNAQTHQENKDLAATRTAFEQTKNWALSTNCSALAEESVSTQRAAKAVGAECRTDGWLQFEEGELQQRKNFLERNATWHVMQLPCPSSAPLINTPPNALASTTTTTTSTSPPTTTLHPHYDLSFFFSPQRENGLNNNNNNDLIHLRSNSSTSCEDDHCVESQTLQLFPLRSAGDDDNNINHKEETHISASAMNANFTPSQFFEFLPLKN